MANTHDLFNPCFYPRIKPARILSRHTGGYYHSMSEAPFGKFLADHGRLHLDYDTDTVEYAYDPSIPVSSPRYTPDFNMYYGKDASGNIIADLVDIKAKGPDADHKVQQLAADVRAGILGNIHDYKRANKSIYPRAFIIATASRLYYYDTTTDDPDGVPARIYKCPSCGKVEILPAHRLVCTKCGHAYDIDDQFCSPAEAMVQYARRDATRTERTDKYRTLFVQRCRQYNIDAYDLSNRKLAVKQKLLRIELPEFPSQYYESDFAYISQDRSCRSYNNTPQLQTHIGIFTDPERDEELIQALVRHAADKETPIDAFVFLTPKGMFITERLHGPTMRQAHFHTCKSCSKGYIASDDYPECPHCH
ncbi:hypothetical protein [Adlercreutzia sp. ZJ138]|uniref:hypothetical protein n=1 Tax=Adlercreutzia sp. ZJ138 TaxID=2709405 RepID=UPI0013EBE615|nr:hypothetical protein [Adlercreutzia sp. ZJ138]